MQEMIRKFELGAHIRKLLSDFTSVARIWKRLKLKRRFVFVPALFSLLTILCEYAFIVFLYPMIQGLVYGKVDFDSGPGTIRKMFEVVAPVLGYELSAIPISVLFTAGVGLLLLRYFFLFLNSYATLVNSQQLGHQMRIKIAERELAFGHQYYERMRMGAELSILNHVSKLSDTVMHLKELLLQSTLLTGYFLILFALIGPWSFLVFMIMGVVSGSTRFLLRAIKRNSEVNLSKEKEVFSTFYNLISASPLIRAYNYEASTVSSFKQRSERYMRIQNKMYGKKAFLIPFQEALLVLLIITGFALVLSTTQGTLPKEALVGLAMTCFMILKRMTTNLRAIVDQRSGLSAMEGALSNILNILDDQGKFYVSSGTKYFSGLKKEIEFRNLSFSFDGKREILNSVNLKIPAGSTLALVGTTGAGKSTITKLLLRYYECPSQSIFLDGTDIQEFDLKSLREQFAHISQDPVLVNDTIKNNITFGLDQTVSESVLEQVIKKARLAPLIESLPRGLETVVGDRGTRVSGGEKQRIAIARAMLKPCSILVLDEATSALDSKTEQEVQLAVDEALGSKTAIVIAHRLSTILKADNVAVVHDGRVVEQGTIEELLALEGYFYALWTTQQLKAAG